MSEELKTMTSRNCWYCDHYFPAEIKNCEFCGKFTRKVELTLSDLSSFECPVCQEMISNFAEPVIYKTKTGKSFMCGLCYSILKENKS